jgi:hypothetical protein
MNNLPANFLNTAERFAEERLIRSTPFADIKDAKAEQVKVNFFRLLAGLVILIQVAITTYASFHYHDPALVFGMAIPMQTLVSLAMCGLLLLFVLGLMTPLVTLLLIALYYPYCNYMQTANLGTDVFQGILVLFFLANAGAYYSLDQKILERPQHWLHRAIKGLYHILAFPNERQLGVVYYLAFWGFAVMPIPAGFMNFSV